MEKIIKDQVFEAEKNQFSIHLYIKKYKNWVQVDNQELYDNMINGANEDDEYNNEKWINFEIRVKLINLKDTLKDKI